MSERDLEAKTVSPAASGERKLGSLFLLVILLVGAILLAYTFRPWADRDGGTAAGLTPGMVDTGARPEPGEKAPDFVLERADGTLLRLSDFEGRPVFLNFWADWCTFCKQEMPDMQRIAERYGDALVVLGVNAGDPVEVGEQFASRAGISYERVYDKNLAVTDGYLVRAMPTSYFIAADGTIVDVSFGVMDYDTMLEKVETVAGVASD